MRQVDVRGKKVQEGVRGKKMGQPSLEVGRNFGISPGPELGQVGEWHDVIDGDGDGAGVSESTAHGK